MFRNLALLILSLVCLTAFAPQHKKKAAPQTSAAAAKMDYKTIGAPLPPIRVVDPKGVVFTHESIDSSGNFFLMMFNPTCGHCEDVTKMLEKNLDLFRDNQILLVSGAAMMPYLEYFHVNTKVFDYPKIKIGVDSSGIIVNTFVYNSLPQINIYSKEGKLLKIFTSDVPIDSLRPYIR